MQKVSLHPTHEELQQVVLDQEPSLREMWARRKSDTDILILADMRRPECARSAKGWQGESAINKAALEGMFLPYLQPAGLIDALLKHGDRPQREAAKELQGFANFPGVVPLWVVSYKGHWATMWAPPGSKDVSVLRHNPVDPQSN
jgi:hypothetical protein